MSLARRSPRSGFVRIKRVESRTRGRRAIVLSDGREIEVSKAAWEESGLDEGMAAAEAAIVELKTSDDREGVHQAALRFLSHRARSEREVRRKLRQKGFGQEAIDEEIARLREVGLLDDRAYAEAFVEERSRLSPRGRRLLRQELIVRGVDQSAVADAVEQVDDDALALELARKRARGLATSDFDAFATRIGPYLQRRGFSWETARRAVRAAWDEAHSQT